VRPAGRPVRIAHAYGNTRKALRRALASDVDMIEIDIWYRSGRIEIRHERRLNPLPLLIDRRMAGHVPGPLAIPLPNGYYLRPDVHPLLLTEVLKTVRGSRRLLLDVKGSYRGKQIEAFARTLASQVREHKGLGYVSVCGQRYAVLDRLRQGAPDLPVRYSIEKSAQWRRFLHMAERDNTIRSICMDYRFFDAEKSRFLAERSIDVYCWTVDDPATAARLVAAGVGGIISNSLPLLAALPGGQPAD
jgi:glycerophosphoryl diester phosphodiesterase